MYHISSGHSRTTLKTVDLLWASTGSILTLTVCAALGKYQSDDKQSEDQPPSYRMSWRRSFMRRIRQAKWVSSVFHSVGYQSIFKLWYNGKKDRKHHKNIKETAELNGFAYFSATRRKLRKHCNILVMLPHQISFPCRCLTPTAVCRRVRMNSVSLPVTSKRVKEVPQGLCLTPGRHGPLTISWIPPAMRTF